jgi:hypothetical protein
VPSFDITASVSRGGRSCTPSSESSRLLAFVGPSRAWIKLQNRSGSGK